MQTRQHQYKSLEAGKSYPHFSEVTEKCNKFSEKFLKKLDSLRDKEINSPSPIQLPISDSTIKGTLAFFAHHEAYHLGQLGLVRRYHGYEGMKYS